MKSQVMSLNSRYTARSLSHAIYYNYVRSEHTLSVTGHLEERHV